MALAVLIFSEGFDPKLKKKVKEMLLTRDIRQHMITFAAETEK